MNSFLKSLVIAALLLVFTWNTWASREEKAITIGKTDRLFSKILNEWRPLEIALPPDFESSEARYPLLIALDGGQFFQYPVSILYMMSPNYFPEMVVVGIPNTDRFRDLNPMAERNPSALEDTARFLGFLEKELLPYLEKKYRTRRYRILVGHSLAGLFTLYALLKKPGMFNAYIATSPSIRSEGAQKLLKALLDGMKPGDLKKKYLYVSGGGAEPAELHRAIAGLDQHLKNGNFGLEWRTDIFETEGHVPIKGFYQGLRGLFPAWIPTSKMFKEGTLSQLLAHCKKNTERYGFEMLPPQDILWSFGRRSLREKKIEEAAKIFRYYVSIYPRQESGYIGLSDALTEAGKLEEAQKNLEKALKLRPDSEAVKERLKKLRQQEQKKPAT